MGTKEATDIRVGNVLKIGNAVCKVLTQEVRGTGKSGKTVQVGLKNLEDGNFSEKSFRAQEKVEDVEVQHVKLQYLYKDGEEFVFMNQLTYEQFPLSAKVIGKQTILLKENMEINSLCIGDRPVSLEFPRAVELKVTSTPPGTKGGGDSNYKEAELENGLTVMVPQFVKEGESVRVNTEDLSYLERVTVKSMKTEQAGKEGSGAEG